MCLLLQHALQIHQTLKTSTLRYRVSGHSFLSNDSEVGDVECALRRQERQYLPEDIMRAVLELSGGWGGGGGFNPQLF